MRHSIRNAIVISSAIAVAISQTGCGGGVTSALPAVDGGAANEAVADSWPTFAYDQRRTGHQLGSTGITTANAASLGMRWVHRFAPETITASPIVSGGLVYVATLFGTVHALDERTGSVVWTAQLDGPVQGTPSYADGMLFVGTHANPGTLYALDGASGVQRWAAHFSPGAIRSEAVVANNVVYEGENDGDPPHCTQGGIHAFDEMTGRPIFVWNVDAKPNDGGAVWAPISFDGSNLLFGTGNTCSSNVPYANAVVKLSLASGAVAPLWGKPKDPSTIDDDFGGGVLLTGNQAITTNKNGYLYSFDAANGNVLWSNQIGRFDGGGGIGTPSTDGSMLVVSDGYLTAGPSDTYEGAGGKIIGLGLDGTIRWARQIGTPVFGYVALANGVAYTALDRTVAALDETTGRTLWNYDVGSLTYASPAIVSSGLYFTDNNGDVYAFGLPSAATAGKTRRPAP